MNLDNNEMFYGIKSLRPKLAKCTLAKCKLGYGRKKGVVNFSEGEGGEEFDPQDYPSLVIIN